MNSIDLQPLVQGLASIFSGHLGFVWTLLLIGIVTWQVLIQAYGQTKPPPWLHILRIVTVVLLVAFGLNVLLRFAMIVRPV